MVAAARAKADRAIIDRDQAYAKGCHGALEVQRDGDRLQLEAAELSQTCAEQMSAISEMEIKLASVQSDLSDKAAKLETAITLNEVQYQRGQAGYEEHTLTAKIFKEKADNLEIELADLQKKYEAELDVNNTMYQYGGVEENIGSIDR
jgi:hypothetical protein